MTSPVLMLWDGEALRPGARQQWIADRNFVVGETYPIVVHEERSTNSHNHFFAAVQEAWKTLPERYTRRFPTAEHLRKYALIKAGYADERSIVCDTPEEALKVGAFVKPMDEFAVVTVGDTIVKVYTAKSQSARAMNKQDFQKSKQDVLDIVAEMIGVDAKTLSAQVTNSSPDHAPAPRSETTPASSNGDASDAGTLSQNQESSVAPNNDADGKGGGGGPPNATSAGGAQFLPDGWQKDLVAAFRRAGKPASLKTLASQYFEKLGQLPSDPSDIDNAKAIRKAFEDNFGNQDAIDAALREIV